MGGNRPVLQPVPVEVPSQVGQCDPLIRWSRHYFVSDYRIRGINTDLDSNVVCQQKLSRTIPPQQQRNRLEEHSLIVGTVLVQQE